MGTGRATAGIIRLVFAIGVGAALGACSGGYFEQSLSSAPTASFASAAAPPAPSIAANPVNFSSAEEPSAPAAPGARVYLFRGLIGNIFSLGMDKLANAMNRRGVPAQTYGAIAWPWAVDTAIQNYRKDGAPIILIGHSTGGDNIISMAYRMDAARVPVALLVTFDPTPIADPLPPNVERALNVYQSTNPIGGGQIKPGPKFHGHLANVNLREHREIIHITMDKSDTLHALVAAKISEAIETAKARRMAPPAPSPLTRVAEVKPAIPQLAPAGAPAVPIKYTVPAAAPIVLWDSGVAVTVAPEETLESISQKYGAPAWAIMQVNNLSSADGIQPGQRLVVPRNAFAPVPVAPPQDNAAAVTRRAAAAKKRGPRGNPSGNAMKQVSRSGGG